jgi:cytochrome P450
MGELPLHCPTTDLDPWSEEALADPYPVYRQLRDLGPVVWLERYGLPTLPRYGEVRAALTDWETFSSASGACLDEAQAQRMPESILTSDPPVHQTYRKPVADQLSVAALAGDVAGIDAEAQRLVAALVDAGGCDGVAELASAFSVRVVADLVGLPEAGREVLAPLGERAFNSMGPADARHADGLVALGELFDYTFGHAADLCPGSRGAELMEAGHPQGLIAYTWPGVDTTVHALSSAVLEFARHPDQWTLVRADRSLIPSAFNEVLRLHAPVQTFARVTTRAVTVGEVTLPPRQRVAVMFGSANRDERRYPDPDRFDVTRNPTDHLAFGRGVHRCVGINLARVEAHALLGALADRVARFELVGAAEWKLNNTLHGLARLPVALVPTGAAG